MQEDSRPSLNSTCVRIEIEHIAWPLHVLL